ncbi:hypothetical protein BKA57DRAFT_174860 [Linnemannia elongata]|nr:hypothetical protein BKA57DRAFT_174860 [Linnemannia elongata]
MILRYEHSLPKRISVYYLAFHFPPMLPSVFLFYRSTSSSMSIHSAIFPFQLILPTILGSSSLLNEQK